MRIRKKALLYDIANLAYVIADTGEDSNHILHKVRDICEEGNIDRVSRVLGLAYTHVLSVLSPIIENHDRDLDKDYSVIPHNYEIKFKTEREFHFRLTPEKKLKIKECVHEFMVCMVLADWLGIVLPAAADVWKFRMQEAESQISSLCSGVTAGEGRFLRRKLNPF